MPQHRLLFIGSHPTLVGKLKNDFVVSVETDLARARNRLRAEWFSLAIIQLQPNESGEDEEGLQFCLNIDNVVPRILLSPGELDTKGQMVRKALTRLEHSLPILTVLMETDGDQVNYETIRLAARRILLSADKPNLEDIDFHTLATTLVPGISPSEFVEELRFLFTLLFKDCTTVHFERPDYLPTRKGEIATLLARPETESVSNQYPMVVKCGKREHIEDLEARYHSHYFPLSSVRPAGSASTIHFGALALPAPFYRARTVETFTAFYCKQGFNEDAVARIHTTIDHLFDSTCSQWYAQERVPKVEENQTLDHYFAENWRLKDRAKFLEVVDELTNSVPGKGIRLKANSRTANRPPTLAFYMEGQKCSYPNPIDYLFAHKGLLASMQPTLVGITHGDFRGANLCVDSKGQTCLEGHENMAWRPTVTDVAGIETTIKYHCLGIKAESRNLKLLYEMERTLLEPTEFATNLALSDEGDEIRKAVDIITHLRKKWGHVFAASGIREYYACLFYFAMRELVSDNLGSRHSSDMRKLFALISAAMICYRIENWPQTEWPGPRIHYGGY